MDNTTRKLNDGINRSTSPTTKPHPAMKFELVATRTVEGKAAARRIGSHPSPRSAAEAAPFVPLRDSEILHIRKVEDGEVVDIIDPDTLPYSSAYVVEGSGRHFTPHARGYDDEDEALDRFVELKRRGCTDIRVCVRGERHTWAKNRIGAHTSTGWRTESPFDPDEERRRTLGLGPND